MLNISNIQHFSVGDGDGIRTTVFLKGCNLCCPWCHNPENLSKSRSVLNYKNIGKTEILGEKIPVSDILSELLEDKDFYLGSGGGVTFSGGEPMLQADSIAPLAALLKENGISVLIDTAGCVPYRYFESLNSVVCGYLFDFKTADAKKYRDIGGDLLIVTENIKRLTADNVPFYIRIPLIPGFNTDIHSVNNICMHLKGIGVTGVDLLPFHRMGASKYEAMGLEYAFKDQRPFTAKEIDEFEKNYKKYFTVKVER